MPGVTRDRAAYLAAYQAAHKVEKAAYQAAYRAAHKVERASYKAAYDCARRSGHKVEKDAYYAAHKVEKAAYQAAYRATHKAEIAAYGASYRAANPEKRRAYKARRRALRLSAFVENVAVAVLVERDHGLCGICQQPVAYTDRSVDHILPLAAGGKHSYANTRLTHLRCNIKRQHRGTAQLRMIG